VDIIAGIIIALIVIAEIESGAAKRAKRHYYISHPANIRED